MNGARRVLERAVTRDGVEIARLDVETIVTATGAVLNIFRVHTAGMLSCSVTGGTGDGIALNLGGASRAAWSAYRAAYGVAA